MTTVVLFAVAAGVGAVIRHLAGVLTARGGSVAAGTLAVNLVGAFGLGIASGLDGATATVVGVAGLGALTTFSTFSADLVDLRQAGTGAMTAYGLVTVVGGVALAWLGLQLA